jgi:hypothetical protein
MVVLTVLYLNKNTTDNQEEISLFTRKWMLIPPEKICLLYPFQ